MNSWVSERGDSLERLATDEEMSERDLAMGMIPMDLDSRQGSAEGSGKGDYRYQVGAFGKSGNLLSIGIVSQGFASTRDCDLFLLEINPWGNTTTLARGLTLLLSTSFANHPL